MKTPFLPCTIKRIRVARAGFSRLALVLAILPAFARAVDVDPPTLSPNGGTFTTFQTIAVTGAGDSFHYTTNGQIPTESDPIVSGGHVEVREPLTLQVIAIAGGVASTPRSADYVITGQVSTSGNHTLVLRADGTVWATGLNSFGQLGDALAGNRVLLTQVPGLSGDRV